MWTLKNHIYILVSIVTSLLALEHFKECSILNHELKENQSILQDEFKESQPNHQDLSYFQARRNQKQEFCMSKRTRLPFPNEMFVLKERNLAWCPVPKSGSSKWMTILIDLSSMTKLEKEAKYESHRTGTVISHWHAGREVAPPIRRTDKWSKWIEANEDPTTMILVRHPFERLVSAFRHKVERIQIDDDEAKWRKWHQQGYMRTYRNEYIAKYGQESLSKQNGYGAIVPVDSKGIRTPDMPTWWEFVQWILREKKSRADGHWADYSDYCSICNFDFQYIIKNENYQQETLDFLKATNLYQYLSNDTLLEGKVNDIRPKGLSRYVY